MGNLERLLFLDEFARERASTYDTQVIVQFFCQKLFNLLIIAIDNGKKKGLKYRFIALSL